MYKSLWLLIETYNFNNCDFDKDIRFYKCGICNNILREPLLKIECGCRYCKSCLVEHLKEFVTFQCNGNNSDCKEIYDITELKFDEDAAKFIGYLVTKCPLNHCSKMMKLLELSEHVNDCKNNVVEGAKQEQNHVMKNNSNVRRDCDNFLLSRIEMLEKKIDEMNKDHENVICELIERINQVGYGHMIFRYDDFLNSTNKKRIETEPFYSDKFGYKMKLKIMPLGDVGFNDFVSIYVQIMKGEWDDIVEWPMQKKITVSIVSQNKSKSNFDKCIACQTPSLVKYFTKPITDCNESYGWSGFIALDKLRFSPHLLSDSGTIYVKCGLSNN